MAPPPTPPADTTPAPDLQPDAGAQMPGLPPAPAYVPPPPPAPAMMPPGAMPPPNPADVPSSAWITAPIAPPPASRRGRSILGAIIGAIVVVAIVGYFVANQLGIIGDKGKILFGTAAGQDLCSVSNQTTSIRSTDPLFFAAVLKHHMDGDQAITFHVTKDGADFVTHEEPADGQAFDCYGNRESLDALPAGTYVFEVLHQGAVEATGTLTVK